MKIIWMLCEKLRIPSFLTLTLEEKLALSLNLLDKIYRLLDY
jgi:hypothetical protein